jgi:hypothetical protein
MSFPLPANTKSEINKAGKILIDINASKEEKSHALGIVSHWRVCHGYPVNTFQATLRDRLKKMGNNALVAQRLKRLVTIEDKLKRFNKMKLSTMQDIGGLRAVVKSVNQVRKLESIYVNSGKKFQHELLQNRVKDYIKNPKSDGYRSVHLVYKYINKKKPQYNGFSVELQIRTKLQHIWATAVETMSIVLKQSLKTEGGENKWRTFFAIASSVFAYIEKCPPVPQYSHMNEKQTYKALASIEKETKALEIMSGIGFALSRVAMSERRRNFHYHLIVLNFVDKTVNINSYPKNAIKQANDAYTQAEILVTKEGKTDAVLVSAGNLNDLRRAYPNYFLDIKDFIDQVRGIIAKSIKMQQLH